MLRRTYDNQVCSVAWTLELVGERWTLLIVREALMGVSRFGDFRRRLGVAASVLTVRLNHLVTTGILERVPYHARPTRYEYRLTPSGHDLVMIIVALMRWGDRYLAGEDGPPKTAHHEGCGGLIDIRLVCRSCTAHAAPEAVFNPQYPRPPGRAPAAGPNVSAWPARG